MAIVHAEARARRAGDGPVTLPASTSSAAAPSARADVTICGAAATLRAHGLPRPAPGSTYRVWLLDGAAPRVPRPGPLLELDQAGCVEIDLGPLGAAQELVVSPEGDEGAPRGRPVLRVQLPPGVAAGPGR